MFIRENHLHSEKFVPKTGSSETFIIFHSMVLVMHQDKENSNEPHDEYVATLYTPYFVIYIKLLKTHFTQIPQTF